MIVQACFPDAYIPYLPARPDPNYQQHDGSHHPPVNSNPPAK